MADSAPVGPLPAAATVGSIPDLREPQLHGGHWFWLEQRSWQSGRTTLMVRPGGGGEAFELTPGEWNLRSRLHGYGGAVLAIGPAGAGASGSQPLAVVACADGDRCLWRLDPALRGDAPRRLTDPAERTFGDGLIESQRDRWIGVMESGGRDRLVAVPLGGGEPQTLHRPADFCGSPVLAPGGRWLAWVEWQHPFMPWDRSQLWLGQLLADGSLTGCRWIAGSPPDGEGPSCSVFQPLWLPHGDLVVANDRSGWWNLERLPAEAREATGAGEPPIWQPLAPMEAEFAVPQWVGGLRTTAWDGQSLVAAACRQGRWRLGRITLPADQEPDRSGAGSRGAWQPIDCPFDELAGIWAEDGDLVAVAASATTGRALVRLELASGRWHREPTGGTPAPLAPALRPETISRAEPLWFAGHGGRPTQAWYYPPPGGGHGGAPLLVRGHSGPTGMARTGLNLTIQFWTSRGWGVLDVNYGGSTGFGRAYRERLDGGWGVVDVADCAAATRAVVASGRADGERVAIEGGSAAGFTALAALCFTEVFHAGACRYGVADLAAMAADTHRFEAGYLERLVGPWPEAAALYAERSPLQQAGRIRAPVIFFHGQLDSVVSPEQAERMALALAENGVPVELHRFAGEGHGFRSSAVQVEVLETTEAFFRRHLAIR